MATTAMVHVRVDETLKAQAADTLAAMGLSLSDAVRVFLTRVVAEQGLPFELKAPNAATRAALAEAEAIIRTRNAVSYTHLDVYKRQGQPRAVGKSEAHHNLLPISARLIAGEPLTVQSVKVEMRGRSLRWLLGKVDQRRTYFLNGEIQTAKVEPVADIDRYRPVIYSGQTMTLRYARDQELGPWLDLVAAKGEVFVQFWLRPGEQPVAFELGDEPPADPIPGELRGFL